MNGKKSIQCWVVVELKRKGWMRMRTKIWKNEKYSENEWLLKWEKRRIWGLFIIYKSYEKRPLDGFKHKSIISIQFFSSFFLNNKFDNNFFTTHKEFFYIFLFSSQKKNLFFLTMSESLECVWVTFSAINCHIFVNFITKL